MASYVNLNHPNGCSCPSCKDLREFEKRLESFAQMYMPKNNPPPPKPKLKPWFEDYVIPTNWSGEFVPKPKSSQLPLIVEYVIEEIEDWQREHDGVKPRTIWCSVSFKNKVSLAMTGQAAFGGDGLMVHGVRLMSSAAISGDDLFPTMEAPERGFRRP